MPTDQGTGGTLRWQLDQQIGQAPGYPPDAWQHRSIGMKCHNCMWFVEKQKVPGQAGPTFGRCRRHAPTMRGYPAVYGHDWCGDHKLDENKIG